MAYNLYIPSFISKYYYERVPERKKGFDWLICLDGSNNRENLGNVVLDLVNKDLDKVYGISVGKSEEDYVL